MSNVKAYCDKMPLFHSVTGLWTKLQIIISSQMAAIQNEEEKEGERKRREGLVGVQRQEEI